MLKPNTINRINELVESRIPQYDTSFVQDAAKSDQNLISRGFYNSTVQISKTQVAAEKNLQSRAETIKASIQEVCEAHKVRYTTSLPAELCKVFNQLFQPQWEKVNARYHSRIPVENRRLCQIRDLSLDTSRCEQELKLFAESLAHSSSKRLIWFLIELVSLVAVFAIILSLIVYLCKNLEFWMIPLSLIGSILLFVLVVVIVLRRSDTISEQCFRIIVTKVLERLNLLSDSTNTIGEDKQIS